MAKKKAVSAEPKRGRGRPTLSGGPSVVVAVSVPQSVAKSLADFAEAHGQTKSAVVVEALTGLFARKKR